MNQDDQKVLGLETDQDSSLKKMAEPKKLRTIFSASCTMNARTFFGMMKENKVEAVVDTRINRRFRSTYFSSNEEEFKYIAELNEIYYVVAETLAPTEEMRGIFARRFKEVKSAKDRDPNAWTNFLKAYEQKLLYTKPLRKNPVNEVIYGDYSSVAIICSCAHHYDCHRSYVCGMLAKVLPKVEMRILYPNGKAPNRSSPRRYLLENLDWANLKADKKGGR